MCSGLPMDIVRQTPMTPHGTSRLFRRPKRGLDCVWLCAALLLLAVRMGGLVGTSSPDAVRTSVSHLSIHLVLVDVFAHHVLASVDPDTDSASSPKSDSAVAPNAARLTRVTDATRTRERASSTLTQPFWLPASGDPLATLMGDTRLPRRLDSRQLFGQSEAPPDPPPNVVI
jgi:hypothetical protein